MNEQDLETQIYDFMEEYDMMRKEEKQFRIMPIAFKVKGRYPKEFIE